MNKYIESVKNNLEMTINELQNCSYLYLKNPDKDFTRNRKLTFKDIIKIILSTGGKSLNNKLLEYFSFDLKLPTASAFIQQRDKISHDAFQFIFNNFNKKSLNSNKFKGYRLLAIDGSKITISHNPNDNKTYFPNKRGKGHNSLHLNAAYDLCSRIYTDASIQNGREASEGQALREIVKNSIFSEKTIVIADRGYEGYNNFEHIKQKNWKFLIRAKDVTSNGIASTLTLPEKEIFDEDISFLLTRLEATIPTENSHMKVFTKNMCHKPYF